MMGRSGTRRMLVLIGRTSRRTLGACRHGARLPASSHRISIRELPTSASISTWLTTAILTFTKPPILGGLPKHPLSYVRSVAEDPNVKGLLFVGTGNEIYYSLDDGTHWTILGGELPHAPVTWAVVQKQF